MQCTSNRKGQSAVSDGPQLFEHKRSEARSKKKKKKGNKRSAFSFVSLFFFFFFRSCNQVDAPFSTHNPTLKKGRSGVK